MGLLDPAVPAGPRERGVTMSAPADMVRQRRSENRDLLEFTDGGIVRETRCGPLATYRHRDTRQLITRPILLVGGQPAPARSHAGRGRSRRESPVVISITSSRPGPREQMEVDRFLAGFLPRLEHEPGVVAVYHYMNDATGESTTLIVWEDEASRLAYRESTLVGEAMAFEHRVGLASSRVAFPLTYPAAVTPPAS